MKRWLILLVALVGLLAASPVSAQGFNTRGDHVCFGGTSTVRADDSPENVVLFGCGARIKSGTTIGRDVVSFGGSVVLEEGTRVGRDVIVFGGNVDVGGTLGRRLVVFGGTVTLEPGSVVEDDVQIMGGFLDRKSGATVRGRVVPIGGPRTGFGFPGFLPFNGWNYWSGMLGSFFRNLVAAVALAALGALVLVFLPTQTREVSLTAERAALPSVGVGCLTMIIVPPLVVLFAITCIGIPLAAIVGVALAAAAVFGWIAVSLILGERLARAFKVTTVVPIVAMLVGVFVLWLVTELPILGWLIWVFVAALALGAVVLTRFGTRPYPPLVPVTTDLTVPPPPPPPAAPVTPVTYAAPAEGATGGTSPLDRPAS